MRIYWAYRAGQTSLETENLSCWLPAGAMLLLPLATAILARWIGLSLPRAEFGSWLNRPPILANQVEREGPAGQLKESQFSSSRDAASRLTAA
jgi:hypothetical protein